MTLLNAASRKLVSAPATSRMIVKSQSRLGSRRLMGGDGGDHEHVSLRSIVLRFLFFGWFIIVLCVVRLVGVE